MKMDDWLRSAQENLAHTGSPRLDAQLMLAHVLGQDRTWIIANPEHLLTEGELADLNTMLKQRTNHIPLAQIIGSREFYGRNFKVNEHVLVPRPETEVLVEQAVDHIPDNATVLEIGTGSGCISVSLALERPDLTITATDISDSALEVAKDNATSLGAELTFTESDLFESIQKGQTFDAILANLPYVPVGARRQTEIEYEPDVALYGGEDGLDFYRTFFSKLHTYLSPRGTCLVEYSPTQHKSVREILKYRDMRSEPISEYIYQVSPQDLQ